MNKILYLFTLLFSLTISSQDFQGQAFYKTQTAMDFGSWGDRMSAEQKKSMKERMKPFLEPASDGWLSRPRCSPQDFNDNDFQ